MEIVLPNDWAPRAHQIPCFKAAQDGIRRQYLIWHRRAGKDSFSLNFTATELIQETGAYWHLFPKQTQARKAIWEGIDGKGRRIIDQAFPKELRESTLKQEMSIKFKNGSIWQLCGSDNYDTLVGSNVKGVVFSEWALCDPNAWSYIRPIIKENGGWAIFITTFRGRNHAYRMYNQMLGNPNWFVDLRTVNDTTREDGSPILSEQDIQEERNDGMSEGMINQEYYCLPNLAIEGSYYGGIMTTMRQAGNFGKYDYNPQLAVYGVMDLGFSDHMPVIFFQQEGNRFNIIGSRYWRFTTLSDIVAEIKSDFPWGRALQALILPQDASAQLLSVPGIELIFQPKGSLQGGIELVKEYLPRMYFDESDARPWMTEAEKDLGVNNGKLIDAVNGYHTEMSKKEDADYYSQTPAHTWHSHYADALRYLVLWVHNGGLDSNNWGKAPNNSSKRKGVI